MQLAQIFETVSQTRKRRHIHIPNFEGAQSSRSPEPSSIEKHAGASSSTASTHGFRGTSAPTERGSTEASGELSGFYPPSSTRPAEFTPYSYKHFDPTAPPQASSSSSGQRDHLNDLGNDEQRFPTTGGRSEDSLTGIDWLQTTSLFNDPELMSALIDLGVSGRDHHGYGRRGVVADPYKARLLLPSLTIMEGQPILLFHQAVLLMTRDHLRHLIRLLLRFVSRLPMTERHSRDIALT